MQASTRPIRIGWVLILLFAAGIGIRSLRLAWQPLWWDEGYSIYFATEPLARMMALTAQDIHPPLYYTLLHGWIALWGSAQPVVDRTLSVLFGIVALPLQAWLAWLLFPGRRRLSLVALLLLAVNPMHLFYSQEVRMYGLGLALSLASTAFFWLWVRRLDSGDARLPWWAPALGYVAISVAGIYTLYYFVFVLAGHLLWALAHYRRRLRTFWSIATAQLLVGLFYLPWLLYAVPRLLAYVGAKVTSDQDATLNPATYVMRHFGAFVGGHLAWPNNTTAWEVVLGVAAVVVLAGGLWLARRHGGGPKTTRDLPATTLLTTLVGVAVIGGWLVSLRYPFFPDGGERLLIFALPYVLLLLTLGVDRTWHIYFLGRIALALLLFAAASGIYTYFTTARYVEHDYRPILRQVVQQGRDEDTMLAIFPWQVGYWRAYTLHEDTQIAGPSVVLLANDAVEWSPAVQETIDEALARGALWFPEALSFGSTLPGEIETYLAQQATNLENRWYDATRLTAWAKLPAPEGQPTIFDFGPVQLLDAATLPASAEAANQPVAITLTWQVAEPTALNISLRLLDESGYVWSSRDYAVDWESVAPGTLHSENVGLIAPAGLPPGAYQIGVSVARQSDSGANGETLTLAGSDQVDALIGRLIVTAPSEPQAAARLPIQTALTPPVLQDGVEFLGFTGPDAAYPLMAGTELGSTLFLRAEEDAPSARTLYVSLLDSQGNGVAGYEGWPLREYAVELLSRGELLRVPVRFFAPPTLVSGDYRLVAGFVGAEDGSKTAPITLGEVRIEQRRARFDRQSPAILLPFAAQFGTHVRLYGYDMGETVDGTTSIRLYWEVLQPLLPPHHIFVHADDANGITLAQRDGPPLTATGPAPSGSWQPGEFLTTEHQLRIPEAATVTVGIYDPVSTTRLPVTLAGQSDGDSVQLSTTRSLAE